MINILRIASRNLWRYSRRTLLTTALIALGIVAVLLFRGVAGSFKQLIIGQVTDSMLGQLQVHRKGYVASIDNLPLNLNLTPSQVQQVAEVLKGNPAVEAWSPRVKFGALFSNFTETTNIRLVGVDPETETRTVPLLSGRLLEGAGSGPLVKPGHLLIPELLASGMKVKAGDTVVLIATNNEGSVNGQTYVVGGVLSSATGPGGRDGYLHIDDARSLDELEFIFNPDAAASEGSPPQEQTPRLRGADLIHYDRKIDLAILRLREPISSTSPVTWLQPKVRRLTKVAAIGNPALLDNRISALEVAEGTVTNTSPLQADIKLRGGYSGGPVFTIDNGEVIGMVSANIELDATNPRSPGVGQKISILVSASAIQGTLQAWLGLSETERQSRVTRLGEWFRMQAAPRRVLSQSMTMWFVSLVNLAICEAAAGEAAEVWLKYGDEGLRQWNIKRFPVITRGVQESYAPVHDKLVSAEYEQLRVDPNVQKMIRDKFAYLHQAYEELQERANHLGEVDGRKRKMNIDEFVTLVRGLYARIDRTTDELNEWAFTQIEKTPP